ncbi:MAG: hypothetical protein AAFV53_41750 [Myxococcota bacterium]
MEALSTAGAVQRIRELKGHADAAVQRQSEELLRALGYGWVFDLDTDAFVQELRQPQYEAAVDDLLWTRCEFDRRLFTLMVMGERVQDPFNAFHEALFERKKTGWKQRRKIRRIADAAPRGASKSTIISFADILHDICYGYEAFVVLISHGYDLSEDLVKDLHRALTSPEAYPDLHSLYGPFKISGGETDFIVHTPGGDRRGCRVMAGSFGGQIRGVKHAGIRPTKVVIDDGEHPDKVRSPVQRAKKWSFLTKDILKCGDKRTVYQVVGTVLHPDSMLANLLRKAGWVTSLWKSIISWPKNTGLWETCKRLWADLTDPDREETARRFYERNRDDMDRGAQVLWEAREDLFELYEQLWSDGPAAFFSEKQNEPHDPERQVFYPERFRRCRWDGQTITSAEGRRISLSDCTLAWWLDPRGSDEIKDNDYAGAALVAVENLAHGVGYVFVLEALLDRVDTETQLDWIWLQFDRYGNRCLLGYEDNGFQKLIEKLLKIQRQERRKAGKAHLLPLHGFTSTVNKNTRMISLSPRVALGWIQFADTLPPLLDDQFRQIPTGAYDDGPDAVERAIWLAEGGGTAQASVAR